MSEGDARRAARRASLKRATLRLSTLLGLDRALLARRRRQGALLILNLHRVSPVANSYWPPLHPELFDRLLGSLRERCHLTTFARLDEDARTDAPRPFVILSFDDGYTDFRTHAAPIMETHRVSANLNVVPRCLESGAPPPNVQLYDHLEAADPGVVRDLARSRLGIEADLRRPAAREFVGLALSQELKMRPPNEQEEVWAELQEALAGFEVTSPTRVMSVDDLQEVADRHEIGAHSYAHDSMEYVSDEAFVDDVNRCRAYLRDALGRPPDIYAFPNGSYRESQIDLLHGLGVRHVLLVGNRPSCVGARAHTRLTIGGTTLDEVKMQALGYRAGWRG